MTQPPNTRVLTEDRAVLLAQTGQTPSQAPVAPSPTGGTIGSAAPAARSDHGHPSAGVYAWYGLGQDGDIVLDATTNPDSVTFLKTGSAYTLTRELHARNLTIPTGVTLNPSGNLIHVSGTLSGAGKISGTGKSVTNVSSLGPGATAGTASTTAGQGGVTVSDQYSPGYYNSQPSDGSGAGGAGSAGAGGAGGRPNSAAAANGAIRFGVRNVSAATTGRLSFFSAGGAFQAPGVICGGPAGGGGGGDNTNAGGKGGDGGAVVIVNTRRVTGTVAISAPGADGTAPTAGNCGGGGGGMGGIAILNTTDTTGWTGSVTAPGGVGGAKTGTGIAGGAGAAGLAYTNVWV